MEHEKGIHLANFSNCYPASYVLVSPAQNWMQKYMIRSPISGSTPDQIAAGVAPAYSALRSYGPGFPFGNPNVYSLNEMSTDEMIVPNRATDWGDDVMWEEMWKHTWGPNHPFLIEGWQFIYGGIARVNSILQAVDQIDPKPAELPSIIAELKTIRAFYYYHGTRPVWQCTHR